MELWRRRLLGFVRGGRRRQHRRLGGGWFGILGVVEFPAMDTERRIVDFTILLVLLLET